MKIIDISKIGTANLYTWDRDYLFKVLATGKNAVLHNPTIMKAFKDIDRKDFIPQDQKSKAYMDEELDIGYGESLTRPTILAQMAELLSPKMGGKYLDIGTGTGYFAAILGYVAGPQGQVFTLERVQWLWEMAKQNSTKYKDIRNVRYLYRDGIQGLPDYGPFDGIHISFAMIDIPQGLKDQLKDGGKLVAPTTTNDIRVVEKNGTEFIEEVIPGFVFKEGKEGVI